MIATVTYVVKNFACGGLFSILYFNFVHDSIHYFCANCDKFCRKISPAAGFCHFFGISISFTIPFIICVQNVSNALKNFACGGLFSFLYFNFVHDSVHYLCANSVQILLKNFACGGLSSLLYFNFVHDFINYLCTTVTIAVKKFRLRWAFLVIVFQFSSRFH